MQARFAPTRFILMPACLILAWTSCAKVSNTPPGGRGQDAASGTSDASVTIDLGPIDFRMPPAIDAACEGPGASTGCASSPCGNGALNLPAENCDDGNTRGGDGCSADCKLETDWLCAAPGQPCTWTVVCGDGKVAGAETCDDRNKASGDGCAADCKGEPGWICPSVGARCLPRCGDGVRLAAECRSEPVCTGTTGCASPCGDGLKLPSEACDDGNAASVATRVARR